MAMTLISTATASGVSEVDITSGIDGTYKLYIFKFYDVNPATNNVQFTFQVNAAGASDFNETMTTTFFSAEHSEDNSAAAIGYEAGYDQAQGTAYQTIGRKIGSGADEGCAGELYLFNPSNTTYVKHFYATADSAGSAQVKSDYTSGYINITAAVDEISFKMSSGDMDAVIKMYGVG